MGDAVVDEVETLDGAADGLGCGGADPVIVTSVDSVVAVAPPVAVDASSPDEQAATRTVATNIPETNDLIRKLQRCKRSKSRNDMSADCPEWAHFASPADSTDRYI